MNKRFPIFEARYFGIVIGLFVFLLTTVIGNFVFFKTAGNFVRDLQLGMRNLVEVKSDQKGVTQKDTDSGKISDDIVVLGVDTQSIQNFGRWPWPRYRHADLLSTLSRIKDQSQRESASMLDFFFFDPSSEAQYDASLRKSIGENGKTLLEGVLLDSFSEVTQDPERNAPFDYLIAEKGSLTNVSGDTSHMPSFFSMQGPLIPFAEKDKSYGHATFYPDSDKVFRTQLLVAKVSRVQDSFEFKTDDARFKSASSKFERLVWFDKNNVDHTIPQPLNDKDMLDLVKVITTESPPIQEDTNGDGKIDKSYVPIYRFKEYFVPSITLSLASEYYKVPLNNIRVYLGDKIVLPNPTVLAKDSDIRIPLTSKNGVALKELEIPINDQGGMLINFMGPRSSEPGLGEYQTFTIRPYSGYASIGTNPDRTTWPNTLALRNKLLLAGAFTQGMADDEKLTPVGLMYGVEMHANALNTIITGNFIRSLPGWSNVLLLFLIILGIALLSSRASPAWAFLLTFGFIIIFFFATLLLFESTSIVIDFVQPVVGALVTLIMIIAYRVMTEERDKRMIKAMFGKYVSPQVVDQLMQTPPELGGVDKEISVLFSDIRGFTTLSESMTPQELVNHLNVYLTAMTDLIHEYDGTLDKYVGDEIMCFWGAPLPQQEHALLSCKCALKQMDKLRELNESWPPERRIDIGIGINSGIMTVGNMGSIGRMNYTLMGDNVNLGARLEGTNKQYGTHIIISEFTYGMVKDRVIARELDNIRVKGKNKPVLIYELLDIADGY